MIQGRLLVRIPITLIAAFAVLVALFHGQCRAAGPAIPFQVTSIGLTSNVLAAEVPDHQLPGHGAHCAHCLCHAAFHSIIRFDSTPIQFRSMVYPIREDRSMRALAYFPPFKPPRV
jgi:hypothetical protein